VINDGENVGFHAILELVVVRGGLLIALLRGSGILMGNCITTADGIIYAVMLASSNEGL